MVRKRSQAKKGPASPRQALVWILWGLVLATVVVVLVWMKAPRAQDQETDTKQEEVTDVQPPSQLKPGANYNAGADRYAYSTQLIQNYIDLVYNNQDKLVFLTFDDGPNLEITPKILDILKAEGVPATFFVVGRYVNEDTRPVLERIIAEGHAIGIHSYTHSYLQLYPGGIANSQAILQEYQDSLTALKNQLGADFDCKVFRYPGGHMSWQGLGDADQALAQRGIYYIDWNATNGDALAAYDSPKTALAAANCHEQSLSVHPDNNCRVVLMHDSLGKTLTVASLPEIINYYKTNDYQFGVLK